MSETDPDRPLTREERIAFCREVLERLSELVEGEAPEAFCARVDALLGQCEPFRVYRRTLELTIELLREAGGDTSDTGDDDVLRRAAAAARVALASGRDDAGTRSPPD